MISIYEANIQSIVWRLLYKTLIDFFYWKKKENSDDEMFAISVIKSSFRHAESNTNALQDFILHKQHNAIYIYMLAFRPLQVNIAAEAGMVTSRTTM